MKYARKITLTESIRYEVGQELDTKGTISQIKITYPLAKIFVKGNALPVLEVFLQVGSVIEWLTED